MLGIRSIGINAFKRTSVRSARFQSTKAVDSPLSWVDFLKLKKQNHTINMTSSIFTTIAGAALTFTYLGNYEFDPEKPIMGLDPLMLLVGAVGLGGFAGFLTGPVIGNRVFNLANKRTLQQFKARDQVFLTKIKLNRVDPSTQSFSNPVPDYYGEKIYSLKDYKQWLRDCNAFRRKSREFL